MYIQMRVAITLDSGIRGHEPICAGTGEAGAAITPEVGDEVLVAFERAELRCPYVVGSLWKSNDKPPEEER